MRRAPITSLNSVRAGASTFGVAVTVSTCTTSARSARSGQACLLAHDEFHRRDAISAESRHVPRGFIPVPGASHTRDLHFDPDLHQSSDVPVNPGGDTIVYAC